MLLARLIGVLDQLFPFLKLYEAANLAFIEP